MKLFFLLGTIGVTWIALGQKRFIRFGAYVLGYPFVLLLWRFPRMALRRWPVIIAFSPAIHRAASTLRSTFFLYALAMLAGLIVLTARDSMLLFLAMGTFAVFLVVHLYRAFRKAYTANAFMGLSKLARKLREFVEQGAFDPKLKTKETQAVVPSGNSQQAHPLVTFYFLQWLADVIADKVQLVARSRKYDLYLISSWLYTVMITSIVFSFEYLALHKINPAAFHSVGNAGFFGFWGFSLGILTTSNVSPISPSTTAASILCYLEILCSVLILVILVFVVLTAAREAFREDAEGFGAELRGAAQACEQRAMTLYQLAAGELETLLLNHHADMVNALRRTRGLPELLKPPTSVPFEPASEVAALSAQKDAVEGASNEAGGNRESAESRDNRHLSHEERKVT